MTIVPSRRKIAGPPGVRSGGCRRFAAGLLLAAAIANLACGREREAPATEEPGTEEPGSDRAATTVAVPVLPLAGVVETLAPGTDVVVLIPSGANPATYEPSLDDLRRAGSASIYFELGHPAFVFERTWVGGLFDGSDIERVPLFPDCRLVEDDYHAWLSAECLADAARAVARVLETDEEHLFGYLERIAVVDSAASSRLAPLRGRSVLVLHAAWGYLLRPHGIDQRAILSHGTGDPGPSRVARLMADAKREGQRHVLVQPQFNQSPARMVAGELGATLVTVDPLDRDPLRAIDAASRAVAEALAEPARP